MVLRFVDDDEGYLEWLEVHPEGFVLNTYAHVTSAYLVLHSVACRTINRPLKAGRRWTLLYGKACDGDRARLEVWAVAETGKSAKPCGHCLASAGDAVAATGGTRVPGTARGPRGPRSDECRVELAGKPIYITVEPDPVFAPTMPPLVIDGAQWLAETFFRYDPSASGPTSYDDWIEATQHDEGRLHHVIDPDITVVNQTMAARTSHAAWAPVIAQEELPWLRAIHPDWDLLEITDEEWKSIGVSAILRDAFEATTRPKIKLAVITKVLHIKRPRMIPVLDSVVMQQIGVPVSGDVDTWVHAVEQVRRIGKANLAELGAIKVHLEARGYHGRTLVRILDALLWVSSPGSGLFRYLVQWERVLRPR